MATPSPCPTQLAHLATLDTAALALEIAQPARLVLSVAHHGAAELTEVWAPFDHINTGARLAIVGLTPGRQQMAAALKACHAALHAGRPPEEAQAVAKAHASFAGPMRSNLVALLDDLGLAGALGLRSTAALWGEAGQAVHFTSALRYPVLRNGRNWSGNPGPMAVPMLRQRIETTLVSELAALPQDCWIVPLGPVATAACLHAAARVDIDRRRVLAGLPHPSGANAERIAVFLGRKRPEAASRQTDPRRLLAAREQLLGQVRRIA